jgi:glycosyltransferase involved in cell wall biosynthesis
MVLPSESEGIPRAVLESLFFGVPCILRDVDGHSEVIKNGINGECFEDDNNLVDVMARAIKCLHDRKLGDGQELLPDDFRQQQNIELYLKLIKQ